MSEDFRPLYKKHNSFLELKSKGAQYSDILNSIQTICEDRDLIGSLSLTEAKILNQVKNDIFNPRSDSKISTFSLSDAVIQEINSYNNKDILPRYLIHRYRYEVYPQLKIHDDYPPYLQIEPSSICNYRCVFCFETDKIFTKKSNGYMGHMNFDLFREIVDQVEGKIEFVSLASRGEPLLCPDIEKMLYYSNGKFLNLKMNTNASLLDERKCHAILCGGVKTLVFSVDAADKSLYEKLRVNGKLEKVLNNISQFQQIRERHYPKSNIITRVSGVKVSDDQRINDMEKLWGSLVDQVAFVKYNPWENTYSQEINEINTPCSDLWRRMFVWWDGKINPCDVDYKSTLAVGNFFDIGISSAWRSEAYNSLREAHINGKRNNKNPCARCTVI